MNNKLTILADNKNYTAEVIELNEPYKHPNADKLQCVNHSGNILITSLDAKKGDKYIYFPLECAINKDYLSFSNSFIDPELNKDKKTKSFFNKTGRVRAVRLRGQPSMGYIIPCHNLVSWLNSIGYSLSADDFETGTSFDSIGGKLIICNKYVNKEVLLQLELARRKADKKHGKVKRVSRLADKQFRLHVDTEPLKKNVSRINLDDKIAITYKIHGCAFTLGNVMVKRRLSLRDKIAKMFGVKIQELTYDYIWSSRRVIKNEYEEADKRNIHFYDHDVWSIAANKIKELIPPGISVYGEIVGHTPSGSWIQKMYDYGTTNCQQDLFIYRITSTNAVGDVIEFTTDQIIRFCQSRNLKYVPLLYQGKAVDLFPEIKDSQNWHEDFLNKLMEKYTEKDCYLCNNKVPEEGIVLVRDGDFFEPLKLKSFAFLQRETEELDSGQVNIEDSN